MVTALTICVGMASAHDHSEVSPSGHTLYYNIINGHAEVVRPSGPNTNNYVAGDVVIPGSITYNGSSYPVTRIGNNAFYGCYTSLHSVVIPNSVTYIGEEAFFQCEYLSSVTFGNSVDTIGWCAFIYCYSLNAINLPASIKYIEASAFNHCNSVASITSWATNPPYVSDNAFNEVSTNIPIYIPCGTDSVYRTAGYWSHFTNYHEIHYSFTATSANPQWGTVQIISAPNCESDTAEIQATPNNGFHFVNWSDGNTDSHRILVLTQNTELIAHFDADDCDPINTFPWNNTFDEDLSCWKTVDADGDGYNWGYYDGIAYSESYSYFDGSNQGLAPDNWLISRQIQLPSNGNYILSWAVQGMNNQYYNEHYSVYLSTTGREPANFTTQLYSETINTPNAVNRSVSLTNYRGQTIRIAFRHHNSDDVFVLGLGAIKIAQSTQGVGEVDVSTINVYAENGHIVVQGQLTDEVGVYDILGKKIDGGYKNLFAVPTAGVYFVKIGSHPARKVVVIR